MGGVETLIAMVEELGGGWRGTVMLLGVYTRAHDCSRGNAARSGRKRGEGEEEARGRRVFETSAFS